jgi:hypothetical protein
VHCDQLQEEGRADPVLVGWLVWFGLVWFGFWFGLVGFSFNNAVGWLGNRSSYRYVVGSISLARNGPFP